MFAQRSVAQYARVCRANPYRLRKLEVDLAGRNLTITLQNGYDRIDRGIHQPSLKLSQPLLPNNW